ncbi:uncharacterized protein LOC62_06G008019 [Vanrija pseudolonga]|uniref:Uncharacterized protein n=1 Tax=Vanrija pseudolonga TaxID=143232 RepID=A0AAF0YD31_9TREE|nr:hypothetical protein LOC62_06G008019 [Vanrija pseudolonga]
MEASAEAIDDLLAVRLYPPYSQSSLMAYLMTFEPAATKSGLFSTTPKNIDVKHAKGRFFLETLPTIIRDAVIKRIPNDQPLTFGLAREAYLRVAEGMKNGDLDYGAQPWHRAVSRLRPGKPIKWPAAKRLEAETSTKGPVASTQATQPPRTHKTAESSSDEDTPDTSFSSTELDLIQTSKYNSLNDALKSARDHLPVGERAGLDKIVASALEQITTFLQAQSTISNEHESNGQANSSNAPARPAQPSNPAELSGALPTVPPTAASTGREVTESAEEDDDDEKPATRALTVHTSTGEFTTRDYRFSNITLVLDDTASHHVMLWSGMLVDSLTTDKVEFSSVKFGIDRVPLDTAGKIYISDKEEVGENLGVEIAEVYFGIVSATRMSSNILSERILLEQGFVRHTSESGTRHLYHTTSGLCFNIHERDGQEVILATAWWGWE